MMDINTIFLILITIGITVLILTGAGFIGFTYFKWRGREEASIDSVLLQVSVARGNEIKIDAMEQIFASLYTIKKGGWKQRFSVQPTISFEIVAKQEDIRFYIWTPKKLEDLIEKQIHGGFPDAEVIEVPEYNIFNEEGKVAYKAFQLRGENYKPIKTFKELPTDPMASLTSALAKMGDKEAAAIQILVSPVESDWQKEGGHFISETKKQESDPEKAKFSVSAKTLEAVEAKISKPGFETSIRAVVVSDSNESAKAHLGNISASLEQFSGEINGLKGRKIRRKASFMDDFLYRYQRMFDFMANLVSH